ncbi:MAG: TIGR03087 family PEP-CTERM/XrtA system glycosyltransferase [Pseudomonadota bacterium]
MARDLLYLVHRIPYPPDKGDKIRSWHLLRHLARDWRVHLGAFVDDPEDWRHADHLKGVCADVLLRPLHPPRAKFRSLRGLLQGRALSLPYYRDRTLAAWVNGKLAAGMDAAVVYSSAMAQYVMDASLPRIMDFVDIDSDKWRQYAPTRSWPLSWVYAREGRLLLDWERRVARTFDASLFVSPSEADDFRALAPESAGRVGYFNNGVDAEFFSPDRDYPNPFPPGIRALVFTGAMDYWPNVDAVAWFVGEALPALRRAYPEVVFYIVGSRPAADVQALAGEAVVVTGRVEDVRPYLAHASVVVAPLRIARGIQNKVLEAMAMGKSVVSSPQALEGIQARVGEEVLRAETGTEFAQAVGRVLDGFVCGPAARSRVVTEYGWDASLAPMDALLPAGTR